MKKKRCLHTVIRTKFHMNTLWLAASLASSVSCCINKRQDALGDTTTSTNNNNNNNNPICNAPGASVTDPEARRT